MSILLMVVAAYTLVPPVRIALVFAPPRALPPAVERAAVAEAAAIWRPHGVAIASIDPSGAPAEVAELTVVIGTSPRSGSVPPDALGAVEFASDGTPGRVITIFPDRVKRLLDDARLADLPLSQWPPKARDSMIGRALGRIIAHEIGHIVLRSKRHARSGLMSAVYRRDDLVAPARGLYRLRN